MSEENVTHCPWCGSTVKRTIEQHGHASFRANKCEECDVVFRVEVPHTETNISWTIAR